MDVRFVNPFVSAVRNVFHTMLGVEVKIDKPYIKSDNEALADVSGIIGFSGDATGCLVLSFPRKVAERTASKFAGTEITEAHPDFPDALGELANMIAGNAKKDFEGVHISISLPSVVVGENHRISKSNAFPRLVIPCETPLGRFFLEVAMKIEKEVPVGVR